MNRHVGPGDWGKLVEASLTAFGEVGVLDPILSTKPLDGGKQLGIYPISVMLHQGTIHVPQHRADPPVGEDRRFESADIWNVERRPQAADQPEEPGDRLAGGRQPGKVS